MGMFGGGGGSSTTTTTPGAPQVQFIQSPEQRWLYQLLQPIMSNLYNYQGTGQINQNLFDIPELRYALPAQSQIVAPDVSQYSRYGNINPFDYAGSFNWGQGTNT